MADILICGMEMPKEGQVIVIDSIGEVWTNEWPTRGYFRNDKAKAVPVPPHGRLIDADALIHSDRLVGKLMMFGGEYVYTQAEIDRAPTIIEAEEEQE